METLHQSIMSKEQSSYLSLLLGAKALSVVVLIGLELEVYPLLFQQRTDIQLGGLKNYCIASLSARCAQEAHPGSAGCW